MAALKNHGIEIDRVTTRETVGETEYIIHYSFRSDGHIMRRLVAQNIHSVTYGGMSPHHDYGWKLWTRLKGGVEDVPGAMENLAARMRRNAEKIGALVK